MFHIQILGLLQHTGFKLLFWYEATFSTNLRPADPSCEVEA